MQEEERTMETEAGKAEEEKAEEGKAEEGKPKAERPDALRLSAKASRAPRPGEWLLSVVIVTAAYIYISVLGVPTALGRQIWRSMSLGGYAFYGVFLVLFTAIFLAAGLGCVKARGKKPPKGSWGYLALAAAAALWFPLYLNSSQDVFFFMLIFLHGVAVYWLLAVSGNRSGEYLDERGIKDLGRGFFTLPFGGYLRIFSAWGNLLVQAQRKNFHEGSHRRKPGGKGWQVLTGVGISIPVIALVGKMLTAADSYFAYFVENMQNGFHNLFTGWRLSFNIWTTFATMLVACYLYGLFYNAFHKPVLCREKRLQAPQTMMGSFLIPLTLLYLVFFLVRLVGVAGAMEQIAGGDLWISTYAREGFFELCRVAAVNLLIFGLARWYSPEAGTGVRLLLSGLGGETLAFIGLAFSKMWYYIRSYHSFTFKRAMCCWLLITLFVLFALMTAELWQRRIKGMRIGVLFGCVSFLAMAYSNMPAWAP